MPDIDDELHTSMTVSTASPFCKKWGDFSNFSLERHRYLFLRLSFSELIYPQKINSGDWELLLWTRASYETSPYSNDSQSLAELWSLQEDGSLCESFKIFPCSEITPFSRDRILRLHKRCSNFTLTTTSNFSKRSLLTICQRI